MQEVADGAAPGQKAHYKVEVIWAERDFVHRFWCRWSMVEALSKQVTAQVAAAIKEATAANARMPQAVGPVPVRPRFALPTKWKGDGGNYEELEKRRVELHAYLGALCTWSNPSSIVEGRIQMQHLLASQMLDLRSFHRQGDE